MILEKELAVIVSGLVDRQEMRELKRKTESVIYLYIYIYIIIYNYIQRKWVIYDIFIYFIFIYFCAYAQTWTCHRRYEVYMQEQKTTQEFPRHLNTHDSHLVAQFGQYYFIILWVRLFHLCVCLCMVYVSSAHQKPEKGIRFPRNGLSDSFGPPCGYWELNSCLLEDKSFEFALSASCWLFELWALSSSCCRVSLTVVTFLQDSVVVMDQFFWN